MFYKKIQYPDGDFYIDLYEAKKEFTFRINSYNDLWELNHLIDVLNHNGVVPCVTIPNLISCQADKRFKQTYSFGYKLVHEFLGKLNATFKVFHPHQEMCELLPNVEIIDNSEFIKEVFKQVRTETFSQNTVLFSSDAGGFKPLMKLADKLKWSGEVYGASKSRKYEKEESKLVQVIDRQDFNGKDILIIDDICVYGGTFIGLAKMLKERNVGKLYLAVSHLTVEKPNPELFTLFDKVFTTNSKYDKYFPIPHKDGGGASASKKLNIIKLFNKITNSGSS